MPPPLASPSTSASRGAAARLQGAALEDRVASAFSGAGRPVFRNVILLDSLKLPSEVDLIVGPKWWPWRTYIECKAYHTSGSSVGLEDVAKFKEVLARNGIRPSRGLFIATTSYVPRARSTGVRTLDGKEWAALEYRLHGQAKWLRAAPRLAGAAVAVAAATTAAAAFGVDDGGAIADTRRGWAEGLAGPTPPSLSPKAPLSASWSFFSSTLAPPLLPLLPLPPASESVLASVARAAGSFARSLGVRPDVRERSGGASNV